MLGLKETVVQTWQSQMEWDGTDMCWGGMMSMFWESVGVWSEEQEKARMTKEDLKDASGEGEQECWFGGGGCHESH